MSQINKTYVKDMSDLREKHERARNALYAAGKKDFKKDGSAKWIDYTRDEYGRIVAQVQHDDIEGCTPEMIRWFFEHLGCCTTWNGVDFSGPEVSIYHLWHHRDHVAVTPLTDANGKQNLGFLEGAKSQIHELTNEVNDVVHFEMETVKLDTHEFTFNVMQNGKATGHVKHVYEPNDNGGCTFYAETAVGPEGHHPFLNKFVIPKLYTKESGTEWIHHNIEETGRMQDILPVLYANKAKVFYDPDFVKFD